ncbi:MAG: hypothetical protein ACYCYE_07630 [Clostridia bacterium]
MDKKKDEKTSIDSLEALTDEEIDYPLVYREDIAPLGGRNTTRERYPITEMVDDE